MLIPVFSSTRCQAKSVRDLPRSAVALDTAILAEPNEMHVKSHCDAAMPPVKAMAALLLWIYASKLFPPGEKNNAAMVKPSHNAV